MQYNIMALKHDTPEKAGRGRPKVFDRETALEKALELFWRYGYNATSMTDLVAATGAKAPTLYAEFENKEGLFRAVIDHYDAKYVGKYDCLLFNSPYSAKETIYRYMRQTAEAFTCKEKPSGCFIVCTSVLQQSGTNEVADCLKTRQPRQENVLHQFLHQRQEKGEIPVQVDTQAMARYISCVLQGMTVRAREGADCEDLNGIVRTTMKLWQYWVVNEEAK